MKHLFIINPAAGSYNRTEEASAIIHKICRARKLSYEIRVSTAPGECARIAREAAQTGEELRLYACGGGAKSAVWLQIKADIWNREILPVETEEPEEAETQE